MSVEFYSKLLPDEGTYCVAVLPAGEGQRMRHIFVDSIDELVDSGMDTNGVDSALGVLKKMERERGKNVFLISHRDELQGRVNTILQVIKENGFTSFSVDTEISDIAG